MPYYSPEVCEHVRSSNDIVDVISSYIKLERRGNRYFGLCPFHNEKTGSFCVSGDTQLYHCFGCHESGNVVSFVMKYENMEFTEAIESLAERASIEIHSEIPTGESNSNRKKRDELFAANKAAAEYYYKKLRDKDGERGLNYFKERGLNAITLNSFGLGYTGTASKELYEHLKNEGFSDEILKDAGLIIFDEGRGIRDRFFSRVMFPIMDINRRVIGFGARVLGDGQPKYLNSAESMIFNKSQILYGLFAARRSRRKGFILCEGYMDVISAHMAGFDNAVATLGTALTEGHAAIILKQKRPVYLCYDSDTAGKNAAKRGFEILKKAGIPSKIMDLSPYKDPDEIIKAKGPEEFERRIENAKNAFLTIMQWEYQEIDTNDPEAQTAFTHKLADKISEYKDEAARENYIKSSSRMFGIEPDMLRRMVNGLGNKITAKETIVSKNRAKARGIDRDAALKTSEGTLLAFLLEPEFFGMVNGLVEREDFSDETMMDIYDMIYEGFVEGKPKDAADIINILDDENDKKMLSEIFFGPERQDLSEAELAKYKKNIVLRVKKASLKRVNAGLDPTDVESLQRSLEYAKETIDDIEKLKF